MDEQQKQEQPKAAKEMSPVYGEISRLESLLAQLQEVNIGMEASLETVLRPEEKEVRELPKNGDTSSYMVNKLTFICKFLENEINNERAIIARIEL